MASTWPSRRACFLSSFISAMTQWRKRELSQRQRWEIVNLKKNLHLTNCAVARRVGCHESTVRAILKKEAAFGHVDNLPRSGHPFKLSKGQRIRFGSLVRKHRSATGKELAALAKQKLRVNISPCTALEERKRLGYRPRTKKRRPKLTEADFRHRLEWCRKRRNWVWARAVFLDITTINSAEPRGRVWAKRGEAIAEEWLEGPARGPQAFVLGAISRRGTCSIAIFQGRVDAKRYRDLLAQHILPAVRRRYPGSWFFIQDNDHKQKARVVQKWADQQGVRFLELPPRSPELNPIEKLWGPLKDHVAICHPSSDRALFAAIQQFWKGLDVSVVNQYIDHLPANVQAIIKASGQHIKE